MNISKRFVVSLLVYFYFVNIYSLVFVSYNCNTCELKAGKLKFIILTFCKLPGFDYSVVILC